MTLKVKEVAELVGISVRTLHHYDEIGLLTPKKTAEAGYRLYADSDLERLQQILFFKELGFPLKKIKEIIDNPTFDRLEALQLQRKMLLDKRRNLDQILSTLEKSIKHTKGEIEMSNKERFTGFDFSHNPYEQEARERWGDQAVDQSKAKLASKSNIEQQALVDEMNGVYQRLADLRHQSPASTEAQQAVKAWFDLLNTHFGNYSYEAFKGLGQMYVTDERFTQNIDQFGEGLAQFMAEAIAIFADQHA